MPSLGWPFHCLLRVCQRAASGAYQLRENGGIYIKHAYHFCHSHVLHKRLTQNLSIYLTQDTSWRMNTTGILNFPVPFSLFLLILGISLMHTGYFRSHWLAAAKQLATWQWMANQSAPLKEMHLILQLQNVIPLDIYRSPSKTHAQPQLGRPLSVCFFLHFWGLVGQFVIWSFFTILCWKLRSSPTKDWVPAPSSVSLVWGPGLHPHQRENFPLSRSTSAPALCLWLSLFLPGTGGVLGALLD